MTGRPKVNLKTNLPLRGHLQYCDYAPGKRFPEPQIKLALLIDDGGSYDPGPGQCFLHMAVLDDLLSQGIVQSLPEKEGVPQYQVLGRPHIEILKVEEGKRKHTTVRRLDGAPPAAAAPSTPTTAAAAPPTPPAPALAGASAPTGAPPRRTKPAPESNGDAQTIRKGWWLLMDSYKTATIAAAHGLSIALNCDVRDLDQRAVQDGAATILIRAEKLGLPPAPNMAKALLAALHDQEHWSPATDDLQAPVASDDDLPF